jgi:hypothetical protein
MYPNSQPAKHIDSAEKIFPRREGSPLGGYEINPKSAGFDTQNPYEKLFILIRGHMLINLGWVITSIVMLCIPFVVYILLIQFDIEIGEFLNTQAQIVAGLIYLSVFLSYVFFNFIDWYYDIYLITNERLIDYNFSPLTSVHVSEIALQDIQDIKVSTIGFMPNIFGYGNVIVSSASRRGTFEFHAVPKPSKFRDNIGDLTDLVKRRGHIKVHDTNNQ